MRKILTLCALLMLSAPAAHAIEVYKATKGPQKGLTVDIFGELYLGLQISKHPAYLPHGASAGDLTQPSAAQFRFYGIYGIDVSMILPNSYKIGAVLELDAPAELETVYLYFEGAFGKLYLGQADNASNYLHLSTPSYLAPGLDSLDWGNFTFNDRTSVIGKRTDGENEGIEQSGDSTFFTYDDVAFQVVYVSPSIQGFSFGVSWTPDPCANIENSRSLRGKTNGDCGIDLGIDLNPPDPAKDKPYLVTDVTTAAVQFSRTERNGLDWGISGAYMFGNPHTRTNTPYGYSAGAHLRLAGFEVGGAWQRSRNFNGKGVQDTVWTAGIAYHRDDWRLGGAYRQSRRVWEVADITSSDVSGVSKNREVEVGLAYKLLTSDLWVSMAFEHVWDTNPAGETLRSYGGAMYLSYSF